MRLTLFIVILFFAAGCKPSLNNEEMRAVFTFRDLSWSGISRTRGTAQITTGQASQATLPTGYREVSVLTSDDDGFDATSPVLKMSHGGARCGINQTTIAAKIADCGYTMWNGKENGIGGESNWFLVIRTSGGKEIWQDSATGLIWSENLYLGGGAEPIPNDAADWCHAVGYSDNDPNTICNATVNNPYINTSYCVESNSVGARLIPKLSTENWAAGRYDERKGYMGFNSSGSNPRVRWRLPTRADWLQADIDGSRFVLPNFLSHFFWTATVNSTDRTKALTYSTLSPTALTPFALTSALIYPLERWKDTAWIRCVGQVIE